MLTKSQLEELASDKSNNWKYGGLSRIYNIHIDRFRGMLRRAKKLGLKCDFEDNDRGHVNFIYYIGDIPEGMVRPSVGRFDHTKGYVVGNFRWQEYDENKSEGSSRLMKKFHQEGRNISRNNKKFQQLEKLFLRKVFDMDELILNEEIRNLGYVSSYELARSIKRNFRIQAISNNRGVELTLIRYYI